MYQLTHSQFLEKIAHKAALPLEPYTRGKDKILFRCTIHGCTYRTTPHTLINEAGNGCHTCKAENQAARMRKPNAILEDHGNWLLVDVSRPKIPDTAMKIDATDWPRINSMGRAMNMGRYCAVWDGERYHMLHRLILRLTNKNVFADHINHDTLDNRKQNLRAVSISQNGMNRKPDHNSPSGYKGITRNGRIGDSFRWLADITVNRKSVRLGAFVHFRDALDARLEAEARLFGKFAYDYNMKETT